LALFAGGNYASRPNIDKTSEKCYIKIKTRQKYKGENMTAVRKLVDAHVLADIFDLPPAFKNKKIEVILLPAESSAEDAAAPPLKEGFSRFSTAQIEEWAKAPEIQTLVGALKGVGLPADISITDIRSERLAEKYTI